MSDGCRGGWAMPALLAMKVLRWRACMCAPLLGRHRAGTGLPRNAWGLTAAACPWAAAWRSPADHARPHSALAHDIPVARCYTTSMSSSAHIRAGWSSRMQHGFYGPWSESTPAGRARRLRAWWQGSAAASSQPLIAVWAAVPGGPAVYPLPSPLAPFHLCHVISGSPSSQRAHAGQGL